MRATIEFHTLPGWEIVGKGLEDLRGGNSDTIEAILVMMAMPRLQVHTDLLSIPDVLKPIRPLNISLYEKLSDYGNSAHARYNSLRRRLLKFCNALDQLNTRTKPQGH